MSDSATDYAEQVRAYRERKDEAFRDERQSPLPAADRETFEGLNYYPPDEDYRFVVPLHEHDEKETVVVGTSTEGEREYVRWGEFRVEIGGEDATIQAYKSDPDDDRLWVPFRDATSGDETYGAGRYIDLEPDHRTEGGEWVLDFNLAYNPTCAYSDRYECPLPPTENWLDVAVEAGEQSFH
ncbi:DUF1684 domain-containing protein [Haloarculaceae archaeon H-GB1-1]|nr:DUF1684 domain-containing protein [Haloarculaceae archaeon H-GB1-1]